MTDVICPRCGRYVGHYDDKSKIDKTYKCSKCRRMVVLHVADMSLEVKFLPERKTSSGLMFM